MAKGDRTGSKKAIQIAHRKFEECKREGKAKPSQMCPETTVYRLVGGGD